MTQKYPEVLRIDGDGKRLGHGGRRQFSISSTLYRQFSRDIVSHMADALGHEPNVMGWKIGTENTDESYGPEPRPAWEAWPKQHYGTPDNPIGRDDGREQRRE